MEGRRKKELGEISHWRNLTGQVEKVDPMREPEKKHSERREEHPGSVLCGSQERV